jgi:hypothetical protein
MDLNEARVSCVEHTYTCVQNYLFRSVDYTKNIFHFEYKIDILFINRSHVCQSSCRIGALFSWIKTQIFFFIGRRLVG